MTAAKQAQLVGAAGLAAALLFVAFLGHQLVTAAGTASHGLGVALAIPAATALGALLAARVASKATAERLQAKAAHAGALAGASLLMALVAITWASRRVAKANGASEWADVLSISAGWLVVAIFLGAAMALTLRAAERRLGRTLFAMGAGSAAASLVLPQALRFGAPHLTLLVAALIALAALLLGVAARGGQPHWPSLWTLPLVAFAMYAGDVGQPWLKLRTDVGRHSKIQHHEWTTEGLIAAKRVRHGTGTLLIGHSPSVPLAKKQKAKQKPPFKKQDLIYSIAVKERGPVMVIGSLGGREVVAARAYGHPTVHYVAPHTRLLNGLLLDRYAAVSGYALHDPAHLDFSIGNGQLAPPMHWGRYQHVVVMGDDYLRRTPPRLLPHDDRRYSHAAVANYLAYLDTTQGGAVSLQVSDLTLLPDVFATAREVLRASYDNPLEHLVVCSDDNDAIVLLSLSPLNAAVSRKLRQRCRKGRMKLSYPAPPHGRKALRVPQRGGSKIKPAAKTAVPESPADVERRLLLTGQASDKGFPFLGARPAVGTLPTVMRQSLASLKPQPKEAKKPKKPTREVAKEKTPEPAALAERVASIGLGLAGTLLGLMVVLLAVVMAPRRRTLSTSMRLALPLFGVGTALVSYALADMTLRALGNASLAWSLVLPLGMVGWGGGGLVADVPRATGRRRAIIQAGVFGVALLAGTALLVGPGGWLQQLSVAGATYAGGALLLLAGGALAATPMMCAKYLGEGHSGGSAWAWGAHYAGWGLGGALALVMAHYLPMPRLLYLGVAAYALAALCVAMGLRTRR